MLACRRTLFSHCSKLGSSDKRSKTAVVMDTGSLITDDRISRCHFVWTFFFLVDCKHHNSTSLTVQSMKHSVVYLTVNSTHDAVCLKVNSAVCVSWRPLCFWSSFQLFCLVSISFFLITASLHFLPVELPLLFPFAVLFLAAHSFITLMCWHRPAHL